MRDSSRSQASCRDHSGACRARSVMLGRTQRRGRCCRRCCWCSQRRGCQGRGAPGGCTKERSELAFGTGTHSPQQRSQPLALVSCEVLCPLPGHRWAGGGEKPRADPLAAPPGWGCPGPLPQSTALPRAQFAWHAWWQRGSFAFCFSFPLSVSVAGFLCPVSFLGGTTASLRAVAGEHPPVRPAVPHAGRLAALRARILHSFTSFR